MRFGSREVIAVVTARTRAEIARGQQHVTQARCRRRREQSRARGVCVSCQKPSEFGREGRPGRLLHPLRTEASRARAE